MNFSRTKGTRAPRVLLRVALAAGAIGFAVSTMTPASADTAVQRAVAAFKHGATVFADPPAIGHPLSHADVRTIKKTISQASSPFYVAVLGEPHHEQAQVDLHNLVDGVHADATYIVVGTGGFVAASDEPGVKGQTAALVSEALGEHTNDATGALVDFIQLADQAASSPDSGTDNPPEGVVPLQPTSTDHGGTSPFVAIFVVAGLAILVAFAVRAFRRSQGSSWTAEQLAEVRQAAAEDVTKLGEELTALDVPPSSAPDALADYQAALDAYDRAKAALARVSRPQDISAVTVPLEEGRWRLACVRARLAGQPLPARRPPCFFNPQHGPSTTDVQWTSPDGTTRTVPACAVDADRLARGPEPDSRLVSAAGRSVPYWNAPAYYRPYAGGFFGGWGGGSFLGGLLLGELLSGSSGWGAYDAGYAAAAQSGNVGDFAGGFDSGGGGWGGGDFAGGFDTGGGSFGGGGDFGGGGGGGFDSGGGDFGGGGGNW